MFAARKTVNRPNRERESERDNAVLTDNGLNGHPATQSISLTGTGLQQSQTITFNAISIAPRLSQLPLMLMMLIVPNHSNSDPRITCRLPPPPPT
jgi:hypothetical protein